MILLDTHILLWLALNPDFLSSKVAHKIEENKIMYISDITIWEIAILNAKKRINLPIEFTEFLSLVFESRNIEVIPINAEIAKIALNLSLHQKDPADRIICATAKYLNALLLTKDKSILDCKEIKALW